MLSLIDCFKGVLIAPKSQTKIWTTINAKPLYESQMKTLICTNIKSLIIFFNFFRPQKIFVKNFDFLWKKHNLSPKLYNVISMQLIIPIQNQLILKLLHVTSKKRLYFKQDKIENSRWQTKCAPVDLQSLKLRLAMGGLPQKQNVS
jgi:hypothetical protein